MGICPSADANFVGLGWAQGFCICDFFLKYLGEKMLDGTVHKKKLFNDL
jgi:hypothetical protein